MGNIKRNLLLVLFCTLALLAGVAGAQTGRPRYPDKPIRIIVGFPPGGQADTVARLLGRALTESLRQPIMVENMPGAAGNIAAERIARAAPDGYTLGLLASPQLVINPTLHKAGYDPIRDFSPISQITTGPTILAVHNDVPASTVGELVRLARARPGELTYASSGSGTEGHLTAELLKSIARIEVRHVPYKGVVGAIPDLIGGRVTMMFSPAGVVLPLARDRKLRAIAVTSLKRCSAAPDVPTIAESGYPGFEVTGWSALMAPAGTAVTIIRTLHAEAVKALSQQELRVRFAALASEPVGSTPDELAAMIESQLSKWAHIIQISGISRD